MKRSSAFVTFVGFCSHRFPGRWGTVASQAGVLGFWSVVFGIGIFLLASILRSAATDGPLTPEEAIRTFALESGLRIECVAAEPLVVDPVAICFDEQGRLYVAEDRGYPTGPGQGNPPVGQIALLEDTDGDGRYDKRTVFADGLTFPNGVMCWKGGLYVTCAPYLYYLKDTDGDRRADVKQTVFKGFQDLSTTQLRVSHPTLNLDNWVYLTSGLTAAKVTAPAHPDRPPVSLNRVDGRFRPGRMEIEPTAGTAQFGQTFDAFGRRFICSNRNHLQHVVMPLRYLQRNPHMRFSDVVEDIPAHGAAARVYPVSANITTAASHTGYFTAACGVFIYLGTALPEAYRGNSFVCEPAGNLVHRDLIEPAGATFVARRAFPTNEFLASPDNWFRPVNITSGPDGALYIIDMYRKTIEHPDYLPEAIRKVTDFESGKDMGRIYRIAGQASRLSLRAVGSAAEAGQKGDRSRTAKPTTTTGQAERLARLAGASIKQLCADLENPDAWWRLTAQRLLIERQDTAAVPMLKRLARSGRTPEAQVHALRTLEGLEALQEATIKMALADKHPAVREHGIQLAEPRLVNSSALVSRVLALADDPDAQVRFQAALSLGEINDDKILPPLVKIAIRDLKDKWTRAAVLTSINGRAGQFLDALLAAEARREPVTGGSAHVPAESLPEMMSELGRILGASESDGRIASSLGPLCVSRDARDLPWQMATVAGIGDGLRNRAGGRDRSALAELAAADPNGVGAQIQALLDRAGELATAVDQPVNNRLAAVSLLACADFAIGGPTLEKLMDPQQPSEVQIAAIRALGQMNHPRIGSTLIKRERWNGYTPIVRDAALSALMTRTNSLHDLFNAIEAGDVPAWTVSADRRKALMKHKDDAIRDRATALFKAMQPGDRMKVYEEYKSVLALKADGRNGRAVFQKNCANCHVFAGEGHAVGPDLTGIRNQPADVLLLHIIVPEYELMPIYTAYNVETKDDESFSGILVAETPESVTLRQALGVEQRIPRSNIASMTTSRLSLMPQELEKAMTPQELADLIAFLKGE